jgi:hypothetical protein
MVDNKHSEISEYIRIVEEVTGLKIENPPKVKELTVLNLLDAIFSVKLNKEVNENEIIQDISEAFAVENTAVAARDPISNTLFLKSSKNCNRFKRCLNYCHELGHDVIDQFKPKTSTAREYVTCQALSEGIADYMGYKSVAKFIKKTIGRNNPEVWNLEEGILDQPPFHADLYAAILQNEEEIFKLGDKEYILSTEMEKIKKTIERDKLQEVSNIYHSGLISVIGYNFIDDLFDHYKMNGKTMEEKIRLVFDKQPTFDELLDAKMYINRLENEEPIQAGFQALLENL